MKLSLSDARNPASSIPILNGGIFGRRDNSGFTLVELVIVSASMAVIALAIYSTFSSGLKIWQRIDRERSAEDVNIFFEKLTSDLRGGVTYKTIGFSGEPHTFEMPALVMSNRIGRNTIGKVTYSFDRENNIVKRDVTDFSGIHEDKGPTVSQEVLRDVDSLRFQYYTYDKGMKQYFWQDEWSTDTPIAIKVELGIERDDKVIEFTNTAGIPIGD